MMCGHFFGRSCNEDFQKQDQQKIILIIFFLNFEFPFPEKSSLQRELTTIYPETLNFPIIDFANFYFPHYFPPWFLPPPLPRDFCPDCELVCRSISHSRSDCLQMSTISNLPSGESCMVRPNLVPSCIHSPKGHRVGTGAKMTGEHDGKKMGCFSSFLFPVILFWIVFGFSFFPASWLDVPLLPLSGAEGVRYPPPDPFARQTFGSHPVGAAPGQP